MSMSNRFMAVIAALIAWEIVTTYCGLTIALLYYKVPIDNVQLFSAAMTALVSMATGIIGYFYGRAHEQAKRNALQLLAAATPAASPNVAEVTAEAGKASNYRSQS